MRQAWQSDQLTGSVTSYMRIIHQSGTGLEKVLGASAASEGNNVAKQCHRAMLSTREGGTLSRRKIQMLSSETSTSDGALHMPP